MKILQIITKFGLGGAEEIGINLAIGLGKKGHDVRVATVVKPRTTDEVGVFQKKRLHEAGIKYFELGGPHVRLNIIFTPIRLALFFRSWQPDIIHSHTDIPDFMVSLASRLVNVPIARTIHNTEIWSTHRLMGRISESRFQNDLIVHISNGARKAYQDLRARYTMPPSSAQVNIPNGIQILNANEYADRSVLVRDYGADGKKLLFCFAGRFTHQKGFDVLLSALEIMPETTLSKLQIHAFGAGEDQEKFKKQVTSKQLPVLFHTPVPGLLRLFPAFDAVIMPSRFEGFALVPLESQATGVPVICSAAPGLEETVYPGWPLKVPVEDPEALGKLLIKICAGTHDLKKLGKKAAKWASRFSIAKMVEQYDAAYQQYLGEGGDEV